jgi:nucleoside-diphosphate-sugar epimerase
MARFTIIGAQGFIGAHLAEHLAQSGHDVARPGRGEPLARESSHVVYCVGVTADFRSRPYDTVTAHISYLADILGRMRPLSFLYLSSTRVYKGGDSGDEAATLALRPSDPDDLYNATKIAGEALCLAQPNEAVRVVRLSNVFGPQMHADQRPRHEFLAAVIREAVQTGRVRLGTALDSEKDYVAIEDVVRGIERVALYGSHRLYNIASGRNLTHGAIFDRLSALTGCTVTVEHGARRVFYPTIDTLRIAGEFRDSDPWLPLSLLDGMPALVAAARRGGKIVELAS